MSPRQPCPARRQRGITLIEQSMVLAITGVLITVATPGMYRLLQTNEVRVAQTDVIAALQYARATAVTTGIRTLFCPSVDRLHCAPSTQWESGWLLGVDADHDNQPDTGLKYTGAGRGHKIHIRSTGGRQIVRFQADGSAGGSNLTVLVCQDGGHTPALSVVVSNSGRVRGAPATAQQAATCAQSP